MRNFRLLGSSPAPAARLLNFTIRKAGCKPSAFAQRAVVLAGYTNPQAAQLTWAALLRNLDIAEKLGCLDEAGEAEMRRGHAPTQHGRGPLDGAVRLGAITSIIVPGNGSGSRPTSLRRQFGPSYDVKKVRNNLRRQWGQT